MPHVTVYGASDDLVEIDGCEGADEFSHLSSTPWVGDLTAPNGESMRISVHYDGCWHTAVGQAGEDTPFPTWPVTITQHPNVPYSTLTTIEVPEGTTLTPKEGF